jgi:hypothetical protein
MIDFNIVVPPSGLVSYAGGPAPLMGTNIEVDSVTGSSTPANAGTFECVDCVLNFQTGNYNPGLSAATPANDWIFDGDFLAGSFITVSGSLDTDGDSVGDIPVLMLGSFLGPQVTVDLIDGSPAALGISAGLFLDVKNPALIDFFGLDQPLFGTLALSWVGLGEPNSPFLGTALNGRVRNHFAPEPGSTLLLGAGLLTLAALRRRG